MTSHHDPQPTPEQLAQERWLRSLMDEVEREVHAPRRLRLQIDAAIRASRHRTLRMRLRGLGRPNVVAGAAGRGALAGPAGRGALAGLPGAMAGALATAVLALVLIPGGPATPTLSQAAALGGLGAAAPPPTPDPDDPSVKLSEEVGDVYFPNWSSTLGWRPTGMRRDLLDLHRAATVYYAYGTRRLAYTILSAPALRQPAAAVTVENGMTVRTLRRHGRVIVTWRRDGSTCVLTGTNVSAAQLRRLALTDPPPDDG
jgi:hypothetical protein